MAVNHPVAVRFSNERIRRAADRLARAYYEAKAIHDAWVSAGLADLFPDALTEQVEDGAPADGRQPITGHDVHRVMEVIQQFINLMESTSSNGRNHLHNVLRVSVNPVPHPGIQP